MGADGGWHTRGYIPHLEAKGRTQFVTWRLADSLPAAVLETIRASIADLPEEERKREYARSVEAYADSGAGSCLLRNPGIGVLVQQAIHARDGIDCKVHAWVVMPNHVHLLVTPLPGVSLSTLIGRIKGSSSRLINLRAGRTGRLWQPDFVDRLIRNLKHFEGAAQYTEWNPVKAKLCSLPADWPLSSANPASMRDLEAIRASNALDAG